MTSLITLKRANTACSRLGVRAALFWLLSGFGLFTVSAACPRSHPKRLTQAVRRTNTFSGFGSEPNTFLNNLASLDACPGFAVNTSRMIGMIVPPFIVNAFCNEAQQFQSEIFLTRRVPIEGDL